MSPRKASLGLVLLFSMLAVPTWAASSPPVLQGLDTPIIRTAGEFLEYQIQATNNPIFFSATPLPSGLAINTQTGRISGTTLAVGQIELTITASNQPPGNQNETNTSTGKVFLILKAVEPNITNALVITSSLGRQISFQLTATGLPPPVFTISNLPPGLTLEGSTIKGTPLQGATINAQLTATNTGPLGSGGVDVKQFLFNITAPPIITSELVIPAVVGDAIDYRITATNQPFQFGFPGGALAGGINITSGADDGTATGILYGTPTMAGRFEGAVTATNNINLDNTDPCTFSAQTATGRGQVVFAISTVEGAPAFFSLPTKNCVESQPFAYQALATNAPESYDFNNLPGAADDPLGGFNDPVPTWLSIDTQTGLITGLPPATVAPMGGSATFNLTLRARNDAGVGRIGFSLTVSFAEPKFIVNPLEVLTGSVDTPFEYQVVQKFKYPPEMGVTPPTYTMVISPPLPSGNLVINPTSGKITGTPALGDIGTYSIIVTATNNQGTYTNNGVGDDSPFRLLIGVTGGEPIDLQLSHVVVQFCPAEFFLLERGSLTDLLIGPIVRVSGANIPAQNDLNLVVESSGRGRFTGTPGPLTVQGMATFEVYNVTVTCDEFPGGFIVEVTVLRNVPNPQLPTISDPDVADELIVGISSSVGVTIAPDFTDALNYLPPLVFATEDIPTGFSLASPSGSTTILSIGAAPVILSGVPTQPGSSRGKLSVTNATGSDIKEVIFTVAPVQIISALTAEGTVGSPFLTLDIVPAGGDGTRETPYFIRASGNANVFTATNLPAGLSINPQSGAISGIPIDTGSATDVVTNVTINADNGLSDDTKTLVITIHPRPATAPNITNPLPMSASIFDSQDYQPPNPPVFDVNATGGLGTTTFRAVGLPQGLVIDPATGVISGITQQRGTFPVTILATANQGTPGNLADDVSDAEILNLEVLAVPPVLNTSNFILSVPIGEAFSHPITYTGTLPITLSTTGTLPSGVILTNQSLQGTPTQSGQFIFPIIASGQAQPNSQANFTLIVTQEPSITINGNSPNTGDIELDAIVGVPFSYEIRSLGYEPPTFTLSPQDTAALNDLGLSFNGTFITGTPTSEGSLSVLVTATNSVGVDTARIVISITGVTINSDLTVGGAVGQSFVYTITATGNPTTFTAGTLPAGLTLNGATISGVPIAPGQTRVRITASNGLSTGEAILVIAISTTPGAPAITSPLFATGVLANPFSYAITATNNPTSFSATGLPAGLSVTSVGTIVGSPTVAGSSLVTITASNAIGSGTAQLVIAISAVPGGPAITSPLTATAVQGQAFSYQITAFGDDPITFGAGGLPNGLTVNAAGLISGTPTVAGIFPVALQATNFAQATAILQLTVVSQAPVINSPTTVTSPVGQAFSYIITATGVTPITFSVTGTLPSGLSFDPATAAITGVPTVEGVTTVTLTATNAFGTDNETLTITIGPRAPLISSPLTAAGQTNVPFSYQITATGSVPITFGASGLPPGLVFNSAGLISGTPTQIGTFNVIIAASNSIGTDTKTLVVTITEALDDFDQDGFPNELEIAFGSDPQNPNSTPFGGAPVASRGILSLTSVKIKLTFSSVGRDSITQKGSFALPAGYTLANKNATVVVGGFLANLGAMTDKGNAAVGTNKLAIKVGKNNAPAKYSLTLKGDLKGSFTDEGLTNDNIDKKLNATRTVRTFLLLDSTGASPLLYENSKQLLYTAKQGKTGQASGK